MYGNYLAGVPLQTNITAISVMPSSSAWRANVVGSSNASAAIYMT
jgi:hypothetical protein